MRPENSNAQPISRTTIKRRGINLPKRSPHFFRPVHVNILSSTEDLLGVRNSDFTDDVRRDRRRDDPKFHLRQDELGHLDGDDHVTNAEETKASTQCGPLRQADGELWQRRPIVQDFRKMICRLLVAAERSRMFGNEFSRWRDTCPITNC